MPQKLGSSWPQFFAGHLSRNKWQPKTVHLVETYNANIFQKKQGIDNQERRWKLRIVPSQNAMNFGP